MTGNLEAVGAAGAAYVSLQELSEELGLPPIEAAQAAENLTFRTDLKTEDGLRALGLVVTLHVLHEKGFAEGPDKFGDKVVERLKNLCKVNPEAFEVVSAAKAKRGDTGIHADAAQAIRAKRISKGAMAMKSDEELLEEIDKLAAEHGGNRKISALHAVESRAATLDGSTATHKVIALGQRRMRNGVEARTVASDLRGALIALALKAEGSLGMLVMATDSANCFREVAASVAVDAIAKWYTGGKSDYPKPDEVEAMGALGEGLREGTCGELYQSDLNRYHARFMIVSMLESMKQAEDSPQLASAIQKTLGDETKLDLAKTTVNLGCKVKELQEAAEMIVKAAAPKKPEKPQRDPKRDTRREERQRERRERRDQEPELVTTVPEVDTRLSEYLTSILATPPEGETQESRLKRFAHQMKQLTGAIAEAKEDEELRGNIAQLADTIVQSHHVNWRQGLELLARQLIVYRDPHPSYGTSEHPDVALAILREAVTDCHTLMEPIAYFSTSRNGDKHLRRASQRLAPHLRDLTFEPRLLGKPVFYMRQHSSPEQQS